MLIARKGGAAAALAASSGRKWTKKTTIIFCSVFFGIFGLLALIFMSMCYCGRIRAKIRRWRGKDVKKNEINWLPPLEMQQNVDTKLSMGAMPHRC